MLSLWLGITATFCQSANFLPEPECTNKTKKKSELCHRAEAIRDIVSGLPAAHVSLLFESLQDNHFPELLTKVLHEKQITTSIFIINDEKSQDQFCEYTRSTMPKYQDSTSIIFANRTTAVDLLWMIQQKDLLHRKLLYIFYWGSTPVERSFTINHVEALRIAVVSHPRYDKYRVYYNQNDPSGSRGLSLVNWWRAGFGLFSKPVLPSSNSIYRDLRCRTFEVPVLHKPPWNFVEYTNDSFKPVGGRDDKLLTVIADKLNFRYHYFDPEERIQESSKMKNNASLGVLNHVWRRTADFFIGDVTITYERSKFVEFSFLTLVDSEAFVTHRPSKLNEALALVRPFHWQVWPPIVVMVALYGPVLFAIIEAPTLWRNGTRSRQTRWKLLGDCVWFGTSTFLRQGGRQPASSHKVRLVLIIVTLGATYVIGDMYSANLTSLLARPGREKPITGLEQLEAAMNMKGYELLVEKHSSSFSTLQNGTGIYRRLWRKMQRQNKYVIESVEEGMKLVRARNNFAVLGGRETLYFDTKRFGSYNFHLSEKLNTRYSAIAMQTGCPYIENFNRILMQLFEGGILTKMTEEEYERLEEKMRAAAGIGESDEQIAEAKEEIQKRGEASDPQSGSETVREGEDGRQASGTESEHTLQPLNIRMLQGAFYMLIIGYLLSGIVLTVEINTNNIGKLVNRVNCHTCPVPIGKWNCKKWRHPVLLSWLQIVVEPVKGLFNDQEQVRVSNRNPEQNENRLSYLE